MKRAILALAVLAAAPPWAAAWPAETMAALSRDARKLLPRSLNRLLGERESQVLDELQRFPPDLARALGQDLSSGRLRPETVAGFQRLIDGARFEVIADAGHATLSKQPERYRTLLEAFLDSAEQEMKSH